LDQRLYRHHTYERSVVNPALFLTSDSAEMDDPPYAPVLVPKYRKP